jgi:bromodomain and PHD finger-containing protein 1
VIFRTPTVLPNTNITLETPRFDQKIPDSFRHYRGQGSHSENSDASDFSDSCTTCDDFSESYTNSEYGSSGEEASDSEIVSGNNSDSGSYPPERIDEDSRTTSTSDKKEEDKRSESRQSNESAEIERPTAKSPSGLRPLQLVWAKSRGYPWYPALIIDPDIPKGFVLFFDAKRTWQWLPSGKLELLGINKPIDESKLIESRKPADRKAVKKAYEEALHYQSQVTKKRPEGKL